MSQTPALHRLSTNIYIQSVREAFISLVPYLILISVMTLLTSSLQSLQLFDSDGLLMTTLATSSRSIYLIFPLAILLALSYTLGKNLSLSPVACAILSLACFISLGNELINTDRIVSGGYFDVQPYAMILPFIVTITLKHITTRFTFHIINAPSISSHLHTHLNLIIPGLICFALVYVGLLLLNPLLSAIFSPAIDALQNLPVFFRALIRVIMTSLLWFLGIHGDNTYNLIADPWIMGVEIAPNLLMGRLLDFFSYSGGGGCGIALIIAILLYSKDERSLQIAKLSLLFGIFNINELLIFGLPIVFNPFLLIPFVLVPTLLYCLAYAALSIGLISFAPHSLSWITPPLINTYLAGEGLMPVLLQIMLLTIGVKIYAPFVQLSHRYNHEREQAQSLASKLSVSQLYHYRSKDKIELPSEGNAAGATVDDSSTLEDILAGELTLKYQPFFSTEHFKIYGFRATPYLKRSDGSYLGPEFISQIHKASIIEVIQLWKVHQLHTDFETWQDKSLTPRVLLAIDEAALYHQSLTQELLLELAPYKDNICFEITEGLFIDDRLFQKNTQRLTESGFNLALNLNSHHKVALNSIFNTHLDYVLFDSDIFQFSDYNTQTIYNHQFINLCRNVGHQVISSGITNKKQLKQSVQTDPDFLQGPLFGPELCRDELFDFYTNWNINARELFDKHLS